MRLDEVMSDPQLEHGLLEEYTYIIYREGSINWYSQEHAHTPLALELRQSVTVTDNI